MKPLSVLLLLVAIVQVRADAQHRPQAPVSRVEVAPSVGWRFGGSAQSVEGWFNLAGDLDYGVFVDVRVRPDATVQIAYQRQDTRIDVARTDRFWPEYFSAGVAIEYYQIGGTVEIGARRVRPYVALMVGATRFAPEVEGYGDEWRFSGAIGAGVETFFSPQVGLRFDARVLPTFVNTSGGFLCAFPGGCLTSISTDFIVQGSATAGLIVAF